MSNLMPITIITIWIHTRLYNPGVDRMVLLSIFKRGGTRCHVPCSGRQNKLSYPVSFLSVAPGDGDIMLLMGERN